MANGQIVFCFEAEGEWSPADYDLGRVNKSGYIRHASVKFIDDFEEIPQEMLTDSFVAFKKDTISLIVTKMIFNPKDNKLQYYEGDTSKNEMTRLEKINGKEIWGTDGNVPQSQYGQVSLTLGKNTIHLPFENLFEPNLDYTTVHIDEENITIYISALNSDGAGGYAVLWIIENGKFKHRITIIPF